MKQATVLVKLSKEHEVFLKNVTPVEAIILTAEHHRNAGGQVVFVQDGTMTDVPEVEVITNVNGKPESKKVGRSIDDEMMRLRAKYSPAKVNVVLSQIRDIPTEDFAKAQELGLNLVFPSGKFGQVAEHRMNA